MVTLNWFLCTAENQEQLCELRDDNGQELYLGKIKNIPKRLMVDTYVVQWDVQSDCMKIIVKCGPDAILKK